MVHCKVGTVVDVDANRIVAFKVRFRSICGAGSSIVQWLPARPTFLPLALFYVSVSRLYTSELCLWQFDSAWGYPASALYHSGACCFKAWQRMTSLPDGDDSVLGSASAATMLTTMAKNDAAAMLAPDCPDCRSRGGSVCTKVPELESAGMPWW